VSTPDLLARLARLDERDRAWLLGELPPALRHELAEVLADEDKPAERAPTPAPAPVAAGWEAMEPQRVAESLGGEPAWMVSAATRTADLRWRDRLLHAMPSQRRREIEIADRGGRPLGARAAQFVLAACRERIANGATSSPGGTHRQGFAALVDQMKSRFA
jgi:hypothetical protein